MELIVMIMGAKLGMYQIRIFTWVCVLGIAQAIYIISKEMYIVVDYMKEH